MYNSWLGDESESEQMHRGALLLNKSLTAEQRALQEQRMGALRAYRSLLVRIERVQYDLSAVMLRELTVRKEHLDCPAIYGSPSENPKGRKTSS